MSTYKILALDGGGIRGAITAILLERIEKAFPGFIGSADLLAGTSTGGILALGLACGLSPTDLKSLYIDRGKAIFYNSLEDKIINLGKTLGAEYSSKYLATELKQRFGATTKLKDLRKKVVITSFDLDNQNPAKRTWKPKIFHNLEGEGSDGEQLAYKVGLYTSAAPTYFPVAGGFVDGGVFANNPSMIALLQTQDRRYYAPPPNLQDLCLLSVGTGETLEFIEGNNLDWGYAQWIWKRRVLSLIMDGTGGVVDYQCRQILGEQYYRLNATFPADKSFPLDAVEPEQIQELIKVAEAVPIGEVMKWIEAQWKS